MEIIHIPRDDPHTPFEKELPPLPVKKTKSLFALNRKASKNGRARLAQPAGPLPSYVYQQPRSILRSKPSDRVLDIRRSPSTTPSSSQPSKIGTRQPSSRGGAEKCSYPLELDPKLERFNEVFSHNRKVVRNSVSASEVCRPKSQAVKVEYFVSPDETERATRVPQRPRRRQDGPQRMPVARVINTGEQVKLVPIRY